jgi:hypothetical protein
MLPVLSAWVFLLLDYGRVESAVVFQSMVRVKTVYAAALACRMLTSFLANPLRRSVR